MTAWQHSHAEDSESAAQDSVPPSPEDSESAAQPRRTRRARRTARRSSRWPGWGPSRSSIVPVYMPPMGAELQLCGAALRSRGRWSVSLARHAPICTGSIQLYCGGG